MNWIDGLEKEKSKEQHEDEAIFGVTSERGSAMENLEDWLKLEFWNFNLGRNQFDDHSEGHCILAGIDPENSMRAEGEYGPVFLPDSSNTYGTTINSPEELWGLKDAIDHHIDNLKSLGLKGRVHCHDALKICVENKLAPPWLDAANNDFECAKRLPAKLRTNGEIIRRISRQASSKGGQERGKKNAKTHLLNTVGREEFERLREQGFPECRTKSSDRVLATKVAENIYFFLGRRVGDKTENIPEITTVQSAVRKWLKNSAK
jgi:hypothetical protein